MLERYLVLENYINIAFSEKFELLNNYEIKIIVGILPVFKKLMIITKVNNNYI